MQRQPPPGRILAALAVLLIAALATSVPASAAPWIGVKGNHLVDRKGQPVRLLGVNRSGMEYACQQGWGFFDGPSDMASIRVMKRWHVNAVRVQLNETCWLGINGIDPAYGGGAYRAAIRAYVNKLERAGLYVILNLELAAPGDQQASSIPPMPDADHTPEFWRSVASAYRDDRAVLFDLYTEPHDVGWACWQNGCEIEGETVGRYRAAGMTELVEAVRSTGAQQPVMLGGIDWSRDLGEWLAHLPADPAGALVASNHTYDYATCFGSCRAALATIAASYPVVSGEIGEGDCAHRYIDPYMRWADRHGVSYLAWAWDAHGGWTCRGGPTLIKDYDGTPTAFGVGFRDHLRALSASASASAVALRRGRGRPDLTISSGAVTVANGKLKGSFVVRNDGNRRSGRFAVALLVGKRHGTKVAKRFPMRSLSADGSRTVNVSAGVPSGLAAGLPIRVCADRAGAVRERSETNNCRRLGTLGPGTTKSGSSVPTNPIQFKKGSVFTLASPAGEYWIYVPAAYDSSHQTPTKLFVWLHGCGGTSAGDIYNVSPGGGQDWISIAVGGKEGGCWDPVGDQATVQAAIADVKTHFNVDPRRVILGGYSSGGDLAYRMAFYNSSSFAGVLAENTSPFRDTGSSQAASLAAATTKFHVVHLAHLQDTTYPIAGVREETEAMIAAGFPLERVEVDGTHYDEAGAKVNGHAVPGTDADVATYLLPHIDDGWTAP